MARRAHELPARLLRSYLDDFSGESKPCCHVLSLAALYTYYVYIVTPAGGVAGCRHHNGADAGERRQRHCGRRHRARNALYTVFPAADLGLDLLANADKRCGFS